MDEDQREEKGILGKVADKIDEMVHDSDLERGLINQAGAMTASTDMNFAADSPATGPSSMMPGAPAAAGGSLTDAEPVGRADESSAPPDY